jgi:hypothetical protein
MIMATKGGAMVSAALGRYLLVVLLDICKPSMACECTVMKESMSYFGYH